MKVGPSADYLVRVLREEWEQETRPELYAGIFTMTLQHLVDITFVPDVSALAPPWTDAGLPANLDDVSTVEQARLAQVLGSSYAVTPNVTRAGTVETFHWLGDDPAVVRYVTPAEFDRYAVELARLNDLAGDLYSLTTVAQVRDFEVIRFVERDIVAAPWLQRSHAVQLGRGT